MRRLIHAAGAVVAVLALAAAAQAEQLIDARDGGVVSGFVSASGITRLTFAGDAAASVQMAQGGGGPGFSIQHEPATGDLYLTLERDPRHGERPGAASFFVTTRAGFTYQIELAARDTPSTQIEIRNPDIARRRAERAAAEAPLEARIVELTRAMWTGEVSDGFTLHRPLQRERAAGSLRLTVRALHEGPDLTGRVLTVRNPSRGTVPVDESAFMAPGVLAVTIKGPRSLGPRESLTVLVVDRAAATSGGGLGR